MTEMGGLEKKIRAEERSELDALVGTVVSAKRAPATGGDDIVLTYADGRQVTLSGLGVDGWGQYVLVNNLDCPPT